MKDEIVENVSHATTNERTENCAFSGRPFHLKVKNRRQNKTKTATNINFGQLFGYHQIRVQFGWRPNGKLKNTRVNFTISKLSLLLLLCPYNDRRRSARIEYNGFRRKCFSPSCLMQCVCSMRHTAFNGLSIVRTVELEIPKQKATEWASEWMEEWIELESCFFLWLLEGKTVLRHSMHSLFCLRFFYGLLLATHCVHHPFESIVNTRME